MALSRATYNSAVFVNNTIMPKMVGENDWHWGAKGAFLWAGVAALFMVWAWFRLPNSKGLTYAELDLLFEHKVATRKFSRDTADVLKPALMDVSVHSEKHGSIHNVDSHA